MTHVDAAHAQAPSETSVKRTRSGDGSAPSKRQRAKGKPGKTSSRRSTMRGPVSRRLRWKAAARKENLDPRGRSGGRGLRKNRDPRKRPSRKPRPEGAGSCVNGVRLAHEGERQPGHLGRPCRRVRRVAARSIRPSSWAPRPSWTFPTAAKTQRVPHASLIEKSPAMIGTVPHVRRHRVSGKGPHRHQRRRTFSSVVAPPCRGWRRLRHHPRRHEPHDHRIASSETGRLINIVSRGGSLIFAWMEATGNENPFYEHYDEVLEILHEHDVTICHRRCHASWLQPTTQPTRARSPSSSRSASSRKRAWDAGVQVMVEGPGHMALNEIEANMTLGEAPVPTTRRFMFSARS